VFDGVFAFAFVCGIYAVCACDTDDAYACDTDVACACDTDGAFGNDASKVGSWVEVAW
jgi:hypothetical protein